MRKYGTRQLRYILSCIIVAMFISAASDGWGAELLPFPNEQKQSQTKGKSQYNEEFRDEIASLNCDELLTLKNGLAEKRGATDDVRERDYYYELIRIVDNSRKQKKCK